MSNSQIVHAGIDTRFKPGQSGNPKGRPKGTKNWATIVQEVLGDEDLADKVLAQKPEYWEALHTKNFGYAIVVAMCIKGLGGDVRAFEALRKAGYGDKVEISSDDDRPIKPVYVYDLTPTNPDNNSA